MFQESYYSKPFRDLQTICQIDFKSIRCVGRLYTVDGDQKLVVMGMTLALLEMMAGRLAALYATAQQTRKDAHHRATATTFLCFDHPLSI